MVQVAINGEPFSVAEASFATLEDLLQHIKSQLPADQVVSSVQLEGNVVRGAQWRRDPANEGGALEVQTVDKNQYLRGRLASAESFLVQIQQSFSQTIHQLRQSDSSDANTALARAVDDLLAFVQWYLSLLALDATQLAEQIEQFYQAVDRLQAVCEDLVEPQMYKSAVVLAEKLESQLQPAIESCQQLCRDTVQAYQ